MIGEGLVLPFCTRSIVLCVKDVTQCNVGRAWHYVLRMMLHNVMLGIIALCLEDVTQCNAVDIALCVKDVTHNSGRALHYVLRMLHIVTLGEHCTNFRIRTLFCSYNSNVQFQLVKFCETNLVLKSYVMMCYIMLGCVTLCYVILLRHVT